MITYGSIIITILLVITALVVPRKFFLLPYILAACFVPADQRIIIASLDFTPLRILVIAGVLRLWMRGEIRSVKLNRFDKLVFLWVVSGSVIYILQWQDMRSLIYKCGIFFDVIGLYWLYRQNIRSWPDLVFITKTMALCALLLVPFVAFEWSTGRNPFEVLGRVVTDVRQGRYRCQASFPHSIMLGLFWATLVPLFVGLAMTEKKKILYWAAAAASVFIVCSTASSTPIVVLVAIVLLLPMFRYRHYGRQITWALCGSIITLHLVMKAPVWHLIGRVNMVGGSTGYHRYLLIDQAINHFPEWAFIGCRSTAHWGLGLQDITNQYVAEGVTGGIVTLTLFIYLLVMAVRTACSYSLQPMPKYKQWFAWCICVSVIGHCISFLGVGYFGQIRMLLNLTLATVGALYGISKSRNVSKASSLNGEPVAAAISLRAVKDHG